MTTARLQHLAEWALLLVFSIVLALHTMPRAWRTLNTDFPNYLLAAQLVHQHFDTSQAYDWRWLQREKDHRQYDQPVIGLAPITPFSTLFVYPLTALPPLQAKHLWLLLQLALLIPIALILQSLTGQPLHRIALFAVLCVPLHRNLLYGQFYILLLALLVAACLAFRSGRPALAGSLIAIAAMTKIFPAIFLLYFLRKKSWQALIAATLTLAACTTLSIAVFGWSLHRHYLQVILPWTLRGEALPPYALVSSSLSTLLHCLFIAEPQWNPHPWRQLPLLAAALAPVLQMLLIAPAILLLRPASSQDSPSRIPLEWSTLLCATLTISTVPASYNFTLLLFPITVLYQRLAPTRLPLALTAVALYLAIGFPLWPIPHSSNPLAILLAPRLLGLIAFTILGYKTLQFDPPTSGLLQRSNHPWIIALASLTLLSAIAAIHHQRGLYDDYAFRIPIPSKVLLAASPTPDGSSINLTPTGYHLSSTPRPLPDQLSFAPTPSGPWVEQVAAASRILPPPGLAAPPIEDAYAPIPLRNGNGIAFLRSQQGHGRLYSQSTPIPITPASMNVLEATALPDDSFLAAASIGQSPAALYRVAPGQLPIALPLGEARYPALSPDGRWLAYSRFQSGAWNLWLLGRNSGHTTRLTTAGCNQIQPSWEPDSHTLLYASDCGRALGLTALCRRRVIP